MRNAIAVFVTEKESLVPYDAALVNIVGLEAVMEHAHEIVTATLPSHYSAARFIAF